jgi:hypothetical protein
MVSANTPNADFFNLTEMRVALDGANKIAREDAQQSTVPPSLRDVEKEPQAFQDKLKQLRARVEALQSQAPVLGRSEKGEGSRREWRRQ